MNKEEFLKVKSTGKFFKCFIPFNLFHKLLKFDFNLLNYHQIFFGGVCPRKGLCLFITLYQWFLPCGPKINSISITWKLEKCKFSGPNQDLLTQKLCGWSPEL